MTFYLLVKFVHIFVAIVLIGGGTGVAFGQRLAVRQPSHLAFALRSAESYYRFLFGPGLILLIVSGFWMAATRWSLSLLWIRGALIITAIVLISMYVIELPSFRRLAQSAEQESTTTATSSATTRRAERILQIVGGGSSLLIIGVIWLMVAKP